MRHVLVSMMSHWLDMQTSLRFSVCCLVLPFALAPGALAQPAAALTTHGRPPHNLFTPLEAVDNVVKIVVTPIGGSRPNQEVTVFRSGAWQREESRTEEGVVSNRFANFDRGISVNWSRKDGWEYLEARQDLVASGGYIRRRTGETQTWAGETCAVWAWRPEKEHGPTWLSCVTKDGIELWQGINSGNDGKVREYFHAIHVERRPLHAEEVQLPAEALDWKRWLTGLPAAAGPAIIDHEVTLGDDQGTEIIIRKSGAWTLEDQRRSAMAPSFMLHHPQASLTFTETKNGLSLILGRNTVPAVPGSDRMPPVLLENPPPETILNRRCTWYDIWPNVSDGGRFECRDADGVVLGRTGWSWGSMNLDVRATRFERGAPPEAAFAPLTRAFSWITG
jgi:hypothetical protein